jgi:hypothetical protein
MPRLAMLLAALTILFGGAATSADAQIRLEHGVNRSGSQYYKQFHATTAQSCAAVCSNEAFCKGFVWVQAGGQCRLQRYVHAPTMNVCCVSGVKQAAQPQSTPQAGFPAGCAMYSGGPPRASMHFVNRQAQPLRLLVNGQRLRNIGPNGQNAERYSLNVGRNTIQIVLPNGQYRTKYVIVVNHGARTCQHWERIYYP